MKPAANTGPASAAGYLAFAKTIAREAGQVTLKWFRNDPETQLKADRTPVTIADREAETLLRDRIRSRYPDHGILGEEHGYQTGRAAFTWVLDPIDGTKSFVLGVPLYAVLVALIEGRVDGSAVVPASAIHVGVVYIPPLDEMVAAARGIGATWTIGPVESPARVSRTARLEEARIGTSDFADLKRRSPALFEKVTATASMTRTWGDAYGYVLVATGRHEAMIDPIMSPWDIGPLPVIVEEAGGRFTDLSGAAVLGSSSIASNGSIHDQLLDVDI